MLVKQEKVMDRKKLAKLLHAIMDSGTELLEKEIFTPQDNVKLRTIQTLAKPVGAMVSMVQDESIQTRMIIIVERMKQLGYDGIALETEDNALR